MTDALTEISRAETQQIERNKQIAWEHFRALAEGRLEDSLALVDGSGVYWRNMLFDGRRPSVSLQLWKDAVKAMVERRLPIPWQAEHVHLINIFAEGDQVVLEIHNDSIPYRNGARDEPYDMVQLFTLKLRDGKIISIRENFDGFLMDTMLAEGSWPEAETEWFNLAEKEKTLGYPLPAGACEGCGMIHISGMPSATGTSPEQALLERNKTIAWEHFCAIKDGRLDDALALLDTKGIFWGAARIGADPRRPYPIESWRRELTQIVKRNFLMPWTDGVNLVNVVAEGDQVMLEIHNTSTLHAPLTGNYNMIYNWVLTLRDGIITDVREYPDGRYGGKMHEDFFPETGASVTPLILLGELPPYELPEGSCLSCGKIHRKDIGAF
jgi:ketosteroid isomerase-like protein